jgi:RNA polymerase sigma-70 factor (ECF subfamily)
LNKITQRPVFMVEDRRVLAGEVILGGAVTSECSRDQAIEMLVREHSRLVYRIAYAVLRQHQDAEDATQETFVRVMRSSAELTKVESPKSWLARIAWRVAVDRSKRGHHREVSLDAGEHPVMALTSGEATADAALLGAERGAAVVALIASLPEKLRQPLILSAMEEMTPREVAATLGINESAVRSRVFRARQILKEKLAAQLDKRKR